MFSSVSLSSKNTSFTESLTALVLSVSDSPIIQHKCLDRKGTQSAHQKRYARRDIGHGRNTVLNSKFSVDKCANQIPSLKLVIWIKPPLSDTSPAQSSSSRRRLSFTSRTESLSNRSHLQPRCYAFPSLARSLYSISDSEQPSKDTARQ
mmetsp:Transcript_40408/g.47276  ORF Transcript_40408/g.47276 Transcript_40408/m.47276 type:complete len:149 (-) Transcript_40408:214-660(-)